jgi:hypothetical protein
MLATAISRTEVMRVKIAPAIIKVATPQPVKLSCFQQASEIAKNAVLETSAGKPTVNHEAMATKR